MYLLVNTGGKYWRMDYRFTNKRKTLALGAYSAVSLEKARKRRDAASELLADGKDPSAAKREERQATAAAANTFELVAREFLETKADAWTPMYAAKWLRGMEKDLFPYIVKLPIATVTPPMLLDALRKCENEVLSNQCIPFARLRGKCSGTASRQDAVSISSARS